MFQSFHYFSMFPTSVSNLYLCNTVLVKNHSMSLTRALTKNNTEKKNFRQFSIIYSWRGSNFQTKPKSSAWERKRLWSVQLLLSDSCSWWRWRWLIVGDRNQLWSELFRIFRVSFSDDSVCCSCDDRFHIWGRNRLLLLFRWSVGDGNERLTCFFLRDIITRLFHQTVNAFTRFLHIFFSIETKHILINVTETQYTLHDNSKPKANLKESLDQ